MVPGLAGSAFMPCGETMWPKKLYLSLAKFALVGVQSYHRLLQTMESQQVMVMFIHCSPENNDVIL